MKSNKKALLGALMGAGLLSSMGSLDTFGGLGSMGRISPVAASKMPLNKKGLKARKKSKAAAKARNKNR